MKAPYPLRACIAIYELRRRLETYRAGGVSFIPAWTVAVRGLPWRSGEERGSWCEVLTATRSEWQAAYEGTETPASRALAALDADTLDENSDVQPLGGSLDAAA